MQMKENTKTLLQYKWLARSTEEPFYRYRVYVLLDICSSEYSVFHWNNKRITQVYSWLL